MLAQTALPRRLAAGAPRAVRVAHFAAPCALARPCADGSEQLRPRPLPAAAAGCVEARRPIFNIINKVAEATSPEQLRRRHAERKLLGWSAEQLYNVVVDVDNYKEFVPWCADSRVVRRSANVMEAELSIGFKVFVEKYTSRVEFQPQTMVKATSLNSALFHHLINEWKFEPGPLPNTCYLSFLVDFQFRSPLYSQLVQAFFDEVARRIVSAFEGRARDVYGPPAPTIARRTHVPPPAPAPGHAHGHGHGHPHGHGHGHRPPNPPPPGQQGPR
eukprot:tig00000093_g3447.t1